MITERRIKIPIFDYKLIIVIYDKWEEVGKYFDISQSEPNAITYIEDDYSCVGIKSNPINLTV